MFGDVLVFLLPVFTFAALLAMIVAQRRERI